MQREAGYNLPYEVGLAAEGDCCGTRLYPLCLEDEGAYPRAMGVAEGVDEGVEAGEGEREEEVVA